MRDYEITVVLNGSLEEKKLDTWVKSFEALLSKNSAKAKSKISPEKKPLAYEIVKGMREAYYVFSEIGIEPANIGAFEGNLKNDESVIRYLIIKKE